LHGQPGTGKTQWVKTMAQALGVDCFEVSTIDRDGDAIQGGRRLNACAAAQNLLKDNSCLLMFDEVEDVFTASEYGSKSPAESRKAWFNQLLEHNQVPTIWISNKHRGLDPAFIRRFDMVFEMTMPSVEQREGMLAQYGQGLLSPEALARFAKSEHLAPAIIQRVSRVISPISDTLTAEKRDATFEQLVNQTLALQGHDAIEKADAKKQILPATYNPKYLNTSADMQDITEALKIHNGARICLYGPPGTGKTAYGHYLSTQLDKPLHLKKASDLLSMFVGGTEANMAQAFKTATEEGAILMIDEVDSFISDRNNAVRSWEVTAINEMLTQMEAFEGIFIASTNRMDGLDPAALRRFESALIKSLDDAQPKNKQSWQDYLASGAGGFHDQPKGKVTLQASITNSLAKRLGETPLSEDQILSEQENGAGYLLSASVFDTWQLGWWILAQGDQIEILAPTALRQEIADRLKRAAARY
jgi:SpoVK/Ycf46/Vps4 family AAA+-type ATPase